MFKREIYDNVSRLRNYHLSQKQKKKRKMKKYVAQLCYIKYVQN